MKKRGIIENVDSCKIQKRQREQNKKNMHSNEKGFSLVELVVVILIMAIIAVALAPQIMKWVENSRVATDCSNYDSIASAAAIAMAEAPAHGEVCNQATDTTISAQDFSTDWVISPVGGTSSELYKAIAEILGDGWAKEIRPKSAFANNYVITITTDGTIIRTNPPADNMIS